ncbi:MAG: hypothetical protein U0359_15385 [Byssovorax sp.]
MRRAGWNPTRRSRTIGTVKQGRGQDNRMVAPWPSTDGRHPEARVDDYTAVTRMVHGRPFPILVDHVRKGNIHACTPDDIAFVLGLLDPALFRPDHGLAGVILWQPERKPQRLESSWGRMRYHAHIGPIDGLTIYLDAHPVPTVLRWSRHLDPDDAQELARLLTEADEVVSDRRGHTMTFHLAGIRRVQLFRTLLHEIGHLDHHLRLVVDGSPEGFEERTVAFHSRPAREREQAAHRYADTKAEELRSLGLLPFDRRFDADALRREGLRPEDFSLPEA